MLYLIVSAFTIHAMLPINQYEALPISGQLGIRSGNKDSPTTHVTLAIAPNPMTAVTFS